MIVVTGYFDVAEEDRRAYLDSKAAQAAHTLQGGRMSGVRVLG